MLTHFNSFKCIHVIHDLFKDAISSSYNTVSYGGLINELERMWKAEIMV